MINKSYVLFLFYTTAIIDSNHCKEQEYFIFLNNNWLAIKYNYTFSKQVILQFFFVSVSLLMIKTIASKKNIEALLFLTSELTNCHACSCLLTHEVCVSSHMHKESQEQEKITKIYT